MRRKITAVLGTLVLALTLVGGTPASAAPVASVPRAVSAAGQCVSVVTSDLGWHAGKNGSFHGASWAYPAVPCGPLVGIHYVIDVCQYGFSCQNGAWDFWIDYPKASHYWVDGQNSAAFGFFVVKGRTSNNGVLYSRQPHTDPDFVYCVTPSVNDGSGGSAIERLVGIMNWGFDQFINQDSRVWLYI